MKNDNLIILDRIRGVPATESPIDASSPVEASLDPDTTQVAGISPELMAQIEKERKDRAARIAEIWREGLTHKDWLFDGHPIRGPVMLARFANLDWAKAYIDLGPSITGNIGPYWHVPLKETIIDGELYDCGDTVHRLYPKVLQTKWAMLILHACYECERR